MDFTIHPGRGVGPLRFGMTRDAVERDLGSPDQISEEDVEEDDDTQVGWHYETRGLSLYFSEDLAGEEGELFRLSMIELDALEASVHGLRPIGIDEAGARKLFGPHGLALEESFPGQSRALYELGDDCVWFWFQDGYCESVQVAVPIDESDAYLWPEH